MIGKISKLPAVAGLALMLGALLVLPPARHAFAQSGNTAADMNADNIAPMSPPPLGQMAQQVGSALPETPPPALNPASSLSPSDQQAAGAPAGGAQQEFNPFLQQKVAVKSAQQIEEEIRQQAFNAAVTGLLPMRPSEIRNFLERYDETQQAVEVPIYPYPEPEVVTSTVSLDPGARPPEIKVGVGHVATVGIYDVTGAPWPIQDIAWAGNFEIINPEPGGHVLRITPMSEFAYGNISVRLLRLKTPVTFILKAHRDQIYYRFDARIPQYGPYADVPIVEGGFSLQAGDSILSAILDGVPPPTSTKLDVAGTDGRTTAYKIDQNTYVRTPLTMLSPGWTNSVSSADGTHVYEVQNAPVVLLSDRGEVVRAKLSEKSATP
jgi:intracellular multiplication protein IcmK